MAIDLPPSPLSSATRFLLAALLSLAAGPVAASEAVAGEVESPEEGPEAEELEEDPPPRAKSRRLPDPRTLSIGAGDPSGMGRFEFGTYGRAATAWDLRGGTGRGIDVVAHPPRTLQGFYAEFDLAYLKSFEGPSGPMPVRALFTLALDDGLFHRDGRWQSGLAVRNLLLEARDLGGAVDLWVGSRMWRGDDIYLLDFWPLDELNLVGGGLGVHRGRFRGGLAIGANRLADPSQEQVVQVAVDDGVGSEPVLFLDRPRTLLAAQGEVRLGPEDAAVGGKLKVHSEIHLLPAGERRDDLGVTEPVPADRGFVLGVQAGLWGFTRNGFANLFLRYSSGLAAYGPLAVPWGLSADEQAAPARAVTMGVAANVERGPFGLLLGAYARMFRDADPVTFDRDDGWEGAVSVRPVLFIRRFFHQGFEVAFQARAPRGVEPESGLLLEPSVLALSVLPMLSFDEGSLSRPQLRFVYSLLLPSRGARLDLPKEDPRRQGCDPRGECPVLPLHYVGLQAEWWFNASSR